MDTLLQDLRYTFRTLARAPGFTSIAVLTVALGIGATTAIFTLVDAVLLEPLPFRDPSRIVAIWDSYLPQFHKLGASPVEVDAWSRQTDLFDKTAWYRYVPKNYNLTTAGQEPLEIHATCAPDRLFSLLGVNASVGRTFAASEDPHSVILSDRLWQSRFGGEPSVIGKSIRLNDQPFTVVGVMPRDFEFPDFADVWLTAAEIGDEMTSPVRHAVGLLAHLRPGVSVDVVAARAASIRRLLIADHPKTSRGFGFTVSGLQSDLTAKQRPALLLLFGAVAMVLLIACANVANLLLARASGRTKEIAVRAALGSGMWRLVRQLLTESIVLSLLGGVAGFVLARFTLAAVAPEPVPLDSTVLLFALAVSLVTGALFGLVPALHALRGDPASVIKTGAATGGGSSAVRGALVVAEFALALVLLASAGILAKSFVRLMNVQPGFEPRGLLTMRINLPTTRDPAPLFREIRRRLLRLPGVESMAVTNALPLIANRATTGRFNVPGSPLINPDALPGAQLRAVSPGYFRTMRIPLRSGRDYTERDVNQQVVIINETMARRFWPGRDPVGLKFITGPWGPKPSWSTIVGVVGDVKQFGLDSEPSYDMYFPYLGGQVLAVRASGDLLTLAGPVRRAIHEVDADLPISEVRTMEQILGESARTRRWTMALLAAFAGLALVLALVGIYGVMSWSVAQRTREIGIRMALGAQSEQVMGMVFREAMKLAAAGLVIGILGAFALRRVLASQVFAVSASDPMIYTGAALLMLAAAMLACYVPACRASRSDPLTALRYE